MGALPPESHERTASAAIWLVGALAFGALAHGSDAWVVPEAAAVPLPFHIRFAFELVE